MEPDWNADRSRQECSVGIEEEAFLLEPDSCTIAHRPEGLEAGIDELAGRITAETHDSAFELATRPWPCAGDAAAELAELREAAKKAADAHELRVGVAGTHPTAVWQEIRISEEERYEEVHDAMRELARREPTFALHVHVGVHDPDRAIRACDRMRVHLPVLLALSANSPFYQGRDSGLASARTPLFQAFPRTGIPRPFGDYEGYVEGVRPLLESTAIPDLSHLWWDVRPKPEIGTVEIRIMDAQTEVADSAALTALTASLVKLELDEGLVSERAIVAREAIEENRFLAARDGVAAELIDLDRTERRPLPEIVAELLERCAGPAQELSCETELESVSELIERPGATRQRDQVGADGELEPVVSWIAENY